MNAAPVRAVVGNPLLEDLPRRYPRGVPKFRTVEEAQAARDRVARASGGGREPGSGDIPV